MGKAFAEVSALQPSFERKAKRIPGVLSVGIGQDPKGKAFGFHVLVKSETAARKVPEVFDSVSVVTEVVSAPKFHGKTKKSKGR